ncbi:MAG: serine/threonine-protein kinase [Sandaracinaceae bacterium]
MADPPDTSPPDPLADQERERPTIRTDPPREPEADTLQIGAGELNGTALGDMLAESHDRDTRDTGPLVVPRPGADTRGLRQTADDPAGTIPASILPPSGKDLIGVVIDERWRVRRRIAKGGTSHVYEAEDLENGVRVALKVLDGQVASDARMVDRFVRELTTLMGIESPYLVSTFGVGMLADMRPYYAMEFLDHPTLADLMEEVGAMRPERAVLLARQILLALSACHHRGLVHRDLKPENIMVIGADRVKVVDFGLAKRTDGSQDVTRAGEVLGTPHYMAPEQIRGHDVDQRTDIYAFGVVLYELLTGEAPFDGEQALDVMARHLRDPVVRPNAVDPKLALPTMLEWVVMCCLYKDPKKRFQDVGEVLEEIDNAARLYRVLT